MLLNRMATFNEYMSVGLQKCAPNGPGSQDERQRVFEELVDIWNRRKADIREMSEDEIRRELNCP